jgi:hypothetical protein
VVVVVVDQQHAKGARSARHRRLDEPERQPAERFRVFAGIGRLAGRRSTPIDDAHQYDGTLARPRDALDL